MTDTKLKELIEDCCNEIANKIEPLANVKARLYTSLKPAINFTDSSLQLKEGEVPSFMYWLRHHKYEATKDSNILTKNNNNFVRGKLFKQYRTEYNF